MWKIVNKVESFRAYLDNLAKMRHEIEQEHLKIRE
jgi:hypothetical protein